MFFDHGNSFIDLGFTNGVPDFIFIDPGFIYRLVGFIFFDPENCFIDPGIINDVPVFIFIDPGITNSLQTLFRSDWKNKKCFRRFVLKSQKKGYRLVTFSVNLEGLEPPTF